MGGFGKKFVLTFTEGWSGSAFTIYCDFDAPSMPTELKIVRRFLAQAS